MKCPDNNFISRSLVFYFSNDFYWGIGLLMRWFGSKTRPSNQQSKINDNSEEGNPWFLTMVLKQSKCIFLLFLVSSENNLKAERPNIMIILTDDMVSQILGALVEKTPKPRSCYEGLRFTEL